VSIRCNVKLIDEDGLRQFHRGGGAHRTSHLVGHLVFVADVTHGQSRASAAAVNSSGSVERYAACPTGALDSST
jgi:hypothetical protein